MGKEKSIFYMIQETTHSGVIQNLSEARLNDEKPENKYKGVKFRTILQEADTPNQNRRLYTKKSIEDGLQSINKNIISPGAFFGESSHPITDNPTRFGTILMANACHRILNYNWNGNILEATGETLNNSVGKDMKGLILQGIPIGFSLRAMGKVSSKTNGGISRIEEAIRPFAYDFVHNPSHANALLQNVLTESTLTEMISNQSENLKFLQESLSSEIGETIELVKREKGISYNFKENVAYICTDNSCLKIMLEEHIRQEFKHSFKSLLQL